MLSKIVKLEDIRDTFVKYEPKMDITKDMINISMFMELTIEAVKALADYTKGLCEIQKTIIVDMDKLDKRMSKLEGNNGYPIRIGIFEKKSLGIISLLKQGEALKEENIELKAYKQMWFEYYADGGEVTTLLMDKLEQKYFPKEADHEFKVE